MDLFAALLSAASLALSAATPPTTPAPIPPASAPAQHGVWPVQPPRIVRRFEPPSETWSAGHRGADLGSTVGAPVVASLDGTVTFSGFVAGRGVVVISHGETRTTYEPVNSEVEPGVQVTAGDRIGTLDVTQSHCFPAACLHWGWIRGDEYLDPLLLVTSAPRMRLLPLTPADALGGTRS